MGAQLLRSSFLPASPGIFKRPLGYFGNLLNGPQGSSPAVLGPAIDFRYSRSPGHWFDLNPIADAPLGECASPPFRRRRFLERKFFSKRPFSGNKLTFCLSAFPGRGSSRPEGSQRPRLPVSASYVQRVRQQILFLQGYPGSGKTTLSRELAARLGWEHLDRDQLGTADIDDDAEERAEAYRHLTKRLGDLLEAGESVIVDAPFLHELTSGEFLRQARGLEVPWNAVWVTADREERIRRREKRRAPWDLVDLPEAIAAEERDYRPPPDWPTLHTDEMSTEEAVECLLGLISSLGD